MKSIMDVAAERQTTTPHTGHERDTLTQLRRSPGILILSGERKILHLNQRGWELIQQMNQAQRSMAAGLLPQTITELCSDIEHLLNDRHPQLNAHRFEVSRIVEVPLGTLLLRGIGLPDGRRTGEDTDRMLIIMEELSQSESTASHIKERFQLTEREYAVVKGLAKGWTNKEIANDLGITEPTVKVHISHIMQKTRCTTRTAIVAQLFTLGLSHSFDGV